MMIFKGLPVSGIPWRLGCFISPFLLVRPVLPDINILMAKITKSKETVCVVWHMNSGLRESSVWIQVRSYAFLVAQTVKSLPAMQETWFQPLGQQDPLEKGMATHSSILAGKILWTEDPAGLQVHVVAKSQTQLSDWYYFTFLSYTAWESRTMWWETARHSLSLSLYKMRGD